jgi:hypothetical protein
MKTLKQIGTGFVSVFRALVVLGVVSGVVLAYFGTGGLVLVITLLLMTAVGVLLG